MGSVRYIYIAIPNRTMEKNTEQLMEPMWLTTKKGGYVQKQGRTRVKAASVNFLIGG